MGIFNVSGIFQDNHVVQIGDAAFPRKKKSGLFGDFGIYFSKNVLRVIQCHPDFLVREERSHLLIVELQGVGFPAEYKICGFR